jgi:hypothetical protein
MTVLVFVGPTLPSAEIRARLPCTIMPPARQGDIWRAVRAHQPVAIGLIDGVFFHQPAVWHREILWALTEGVHVFGAASMGALRAAELAPFGMQGVGKVFEAFRDGSWPGFPEPFEDDDEVAVIHAPAKLGHAPLSDAMVDLRDTLIAASEEGVITVPQVLALAKLLKALPFGERRLSQIEAIGDDSLDPPSVARLRAWLPNGAVPRKRLDAMALLDALEQFLELRPEPFTARFRFEQVQAWHDFVTTPEPLTTEEMLVLEEARLCLEEWHDLARAGLGRLHTIGSAPAPSSEDVRRAYDQFRVKHGLFRRLDLDDWLSSHAATPEGLKRFMADEAAIAASLAPPRPGLDAAIVAHLRLTDRFSGLLDRAIAKRAKVAALQPPLPGPLLDAALSWYGGQVAGNGRVAAWKVWGSEAAFRHAVWREYIFVHAAET